jgi:enoyl-CoA hydratase/carnithine racemase
MTQDIYYAEKNQLAIFSFSRPHAKNALTLEMLDFLKNGILKCK